MKEELDRQQEKAKKKKKDFKIPDKVIQTMNFCCTLLLYEDINAW